MRLFDIFGRHPRGDISAHADGELAPKRREALEAHLAECESCRTVLDELLDVRSALRDLPEARAPRSFALTPAMLERRPTTAARGTPSFVAMRVAGAGFAAVLAVVVMLDAGGIVQDGGGTNINDESSSSLKFDADAQRGLDGDIFGAFEGTGEGAVAPGSDNSDLTPGDVDGVPAPDAGEPASDGQMGLTGGESTTATDEDNAATDGSTAAGPESGDTGAAAFDSGGGGVSALLVVELLLAALAVLAIGGSFVLRRRSEGA